MVDGTVGLDSVLSMTWLTYFDVSHKISGIDDTSISF